MALTVAIIGAGRWGQAHIRTLSSLKREGLVKQLLVCDTDLEKLIDLGPEVDATYATWREMVMHNSVDLVAIVTPPQSHCQLSIDLMNEGIDGLVEKPLGFSESQAAAVIAASQSTGRSLSVGFLLRFHSGIIKAKSMVASGAIGSSDAGIYVGQSSQIIVRNSRAEFNVAGIEIENSTYADVYDNVATNNTGGILVFDLPNLPVQGGQATRVFNNEIYENNTENFAPEGNIVGNVPPGTGLLILANDNIEVFENDFRDNKSVNIMVYSFALGGRTIKDSEYDPYPEQIYIHDNNYDGGGTVPGHAALKAWHAISGLNSPNIVWGGLVKPGGDDENIICLGEASNESFMDLKGGLDPNDISYDITPHKCTLPRLQSISFDFPRDD